MGDDEAGGQPRTKHAGDRQPPEPAAFWRALVAEAFGTFALTLVAAGGEVAAALTGEVDHTARALAPGLAVLAMIYALGQVSGAHINPAATLAFALRRDFPWRRAPGYWAAQFAGAILAALLLRALFGAALAAGTSHPRAGAIPSFVVEATLTLLLVTVILGTATRERLLGPNAAIAVGGTVALCGLFAGPLTGASMNPARSLGPALVAQAGGSQWIYVLGPALGAVAAVLLAWALFGPPRAPETEAALGDRQRA